MIYPKENKKIFAEMEKRGAIISEFAMGTFPGAAEFSRFGTASSPAWPWVYVVVEGAQYSGSLITARLAMEFGREVYGVPGNATQPDQLRAQSTDQAGRQAGHQLGGRDRGAAHAHPRRAIAGGNGHHARNGPCSSSRALEPTERMLYDLLARTKPARWTIWSKNPA